MINTRFFPNFKDNKYDFLPVEQPDEFESESLHSTGNGRENKVQIYLCNTEYKYFPQTLRMINTRFSPNFKDN